MLLRRFYDDRLAQASYLLGCEETGEAVVVDANRDIDQYLVAAEEAKLRITIVTETHIHADFASGSRELARVAGARLALSAEGGSDWQYMMPEAEPLRDGSALDVGAVHLEVMHTPGHTPEHLVFLVTDRETADRPMGAFTGDFIFVGDVGRPDLLERAALVRGAMEIGAHALWGSLQRVASLPDYLQLWPGHGAGSACGKSLGAMPQTTLGYERLFNWAFRATSEAAFTGEVLAGQPDPPRYFGAMKQLNRHGAPRRPNRVAPRLAPTRIAELIAANALIVDTRSAESFAAGHIPGTLNIPLGRGFAGWMGWIAPYDRDLHLIVDAPMETTAARAADDLSLIALDRLAGVWDEDVLGWWVRERGPLARTMDIGPAELAARLAAGDAQVLDVRRQSEWSDAHIAGVTNVPLGALLAGAEPALSPHVPVVVQCQGGMRSAIGASVLMSRNAHSVLNLLGGLDAWTEAGLPVESDRAAPSGVLARDGAAPEQLRQGR